MPKAEERRILVHELDGRVTGYYTFRQMRLSEKAPLVHLVRDEKSITPWLMAVASLYNAIAHSGWP